MVFNELKIYIIYHHKQQLSTAENKTFFQKKLIIFSPAVW